MVAGVVRPVRPGGHGSAWDALEACHAQVKAWVDDGLPVVKIGVLLERQGMKVPYRTLHRFCAWRCGFGRKAPTVRVVDGEPGAECQLDFGYMGMLLDPVAGRRRKVHALIFTAAYARHTFVHLSFSQTLATFIAGCEAPWAFFGGVFKVIIPDNAFPVVADADAVNPRFTAGWLDYAQHCGFATDAARVRSPSRQAFRLLQRSPGPAHRPRPAPPTGIPELAERRRRSSKRTAPLKQPTDRIAGHQPSRPATSK